MLESKKVTQFQVSKWIRIPLLVDVQEMQALVEAVPEYKVYDVQRVTAEGEGIYTPSQFVEKYSAYIAYLKNGQIPPKEEFRPLFSSVWSVTESAVFSIPAQEKGKRLLKPCEPAIQLQLNQIRYAPEDKTFRTQVFSSDSISWGILIGFPHLFLNPENFEIGKTDTFPNMELFMAIQRWIRRATSPTPFVVNGERMNAPIRLGKECFSWIANHPQLISSGISVYAK